MKSFKLILCLFVMSCSFNVEARMYKCTDSKGKISYGPIPCKEDQMEKQIQEPYYNEAALQEEARIVAHREAQGKMIENQIQDERELRDAIARGDKWRTAVLLKKSRGDLGTNRADSGLAAMQAEMEAQKVQMRAQQGFMQSQMHRMETQQRLIDQGILKK